MIHRRFPEKLDSNSPPKDCLAGCRYSATQLHSQSAFHPTCQSLAADVHGCFDIKAVGLKHFCDLLSRCRLMEDMNDQQLNLNLTTFPLLYLTEAAIQDKRSGIEKRSHAVHKYDRLVHHLGKQELWFEEGRSDHGC